MATESVETRKKERPFIQAFHMDRNLGDVVIRNNLTLDQFASLIYLPHVREINVSWQVDERLLRRHVSSLLGQRKLMDLKRREITRMIAALREKGMGTESCNRVLSAIKGLCSYAEMQGYLPFGQSPCYKVPYFPLKKRELQDIPPKKMEQLTTALANSNEKGAYVMRLILLTGARKNEILKAGWQDVDWDRKKLRSNRNTLGPVRYIDLPDEAVQLLRMLHNSRKNDWIFPGRGKNRPLADIYPFWNRVRQQLGLPELRIDDLSKIAATRKE